MVEIISDRVMNLDDMESGKSVLGKNVYGQSGEKIGKVTDIVLKGSLFKGLLINKIFIDHHYINAISDESIMLAIDPVTNLLGKKVIDADGRIIGKVKQIQRVGNHNQISFIYVKNGLFKKLLEINKSDIDVCERNIILNKVIK